MHAMRLSLSPSVDKATNLHSLIIMTIEMQQHCAAALGTGIHMKQAVATRQKSFPEDMSRTLLFELLPSSEAVERLVRCMNRCCEEYSQPWGSSMMVAYQERRDRLQEWEQGPGHAADQGWGAGPLGLPHRRSF